MSDCLDKIEVTTRANLSRSGVTPSCGTANDSRCSDPEFAADNEDICPNSSPITGLVVTPDSGSVEVTGKFGFRAKLTFENGASKDVTEDADWSTGSTDIAAVYSPGLMLGSGVGTTTVTARYRGLTDTSELEVTPQCVMYGLDVCLVIQCSDTMNQCDDGIACNTSDRRTRLEKVKDAARGLLNNLGLAQQIDQCSVVKFSGTIKDTDPITRIKDAQLVCPLTNDVQAVQNAIDALATNSPCVSDDGKSFYCACGIGGGLELGYAELTSGRAQSGAVKKVIVLFTDGMENICDPDPATVATDAKADGVLIFVVALDVPDMTVQDCDSNDVNTHDFLLSLSSYSQAFFTDDPNDLLGLFQMVPNTICSGGYGYYGYGYTQPENHHYKDKLDYQNWINWVTSPSRAPDLIGRDLFVLFPPTEERGAYLDMIGTQNDGGQPAYILSKTFFDLAPGRYRIQMELAGNQRSDPGTVGLSVRVSVTNGVYSKDTTITNYKQPFTVYNFDFELASSAQGALKIEHLPLPSGFPTTVGTLLDNVVFSNLTTGEILLQDDFNDENPAP